MFIVVLACCSASRSSKEREVGRTRHVCSSHECADETNNHERVVTAVTNVVDDLVFREETREWKHSTECKCRNDPCRERDWHELAQATHIFLHVKRVMRCTMTNRSSTQEQTSFKECVSEDVKYRWRPSTGAKPHHHVSQLTDSRVCENLLDVILHKRKCSRNDDRDATNDGDQVAASTKMVDECKSELTGVGPAIASGSHVCNGN